MRRRSVDSAVDGSPCIGLERKKNTALQHLARVLRFDQMEDQLPSSILDRMPDVAPKIVIQKPSVDLTSSRAFCEQPTSRRDSGLLELPNVAEPSLVDDGEDLLASCEFWSCSVLVIY